MCVCGGYLRVPLTIRLYQKSDRTCIITVSHSKIFETRKSLSSLTAACFLFFDTLESFSSLTPAICTPQDDSNDKPRRVLAEKGCIEIKEGFYYLYLIEGTGGPRGAPIKMERERL